MNINQLITEQNEELKCLEKEILCLSEANLESTYDKLKETNDRLKYQLYHLEKAIEDARQNQKEFSNVIFKTLSAIFDCAIRSAFPNIMNISVSLMPCVKPELGDYQCNNAFSLAKSLKVSGISKSPADVAHLIVSHLKNGIVIETTTVSEGFINIFLKKEFVANEIVKIISKGSVLPPRIEKQRIIIDYSSPNIAKEMHVGHLRSTVIGDCLARLFRYLGMEVLAINHIGDWGTQFGMLICLLQREHPDFLEKCPSISDLQNFYKRSKKLFDEDDAFKKQAYECVVQLQRREESHIKAWQIICDCSRKEFNKIYERLGVTGLIERGESFYQDQMESMVKELSDRGLLTDKDGMKLLYADDSEIHMLMVKSDGGFTYDTSDMTALRHRILHEHANSIIYVVDSGQAKHFEGLFAAAKKVGFYDPNKHRIVHVGFGVVLGEDGKKFKSRSSETVRLKDLLDEGMERSWNKLLEKGRDKELLPVELEAAQLAVAYGCIKYADLSHHRIKEYTFSFDKMLEDKGNTAVYLLYTYTRISSIARKANVSLADMQLYLTLNSLALNHLKEWKLAKAIVRFPEVVLKLYDDLLPHGLCEYLYELCCTFTDFYDECYCVEQNKVTKEVVSINMERIILSEATAQVLRTGFNILGLTPVQRM